MYRILSIAGFAVLAFVVGMAAYDLRNADASGVGGPVNTGVFTGNVAIAGTLGVTGAVTLSGAEMSFTSLSAGATASTTSAQGTVGASGLISTFAVQADTVGSAGDSFTLPSAVTGRVEMVCNAAAANDMDVFPFTSDSINSKGANAAINLLAGECAFCLAFTNVKWGCVIGVAE